jgi:hypothetical protein
LILSWLTDLLRYKLTNDTDRLVNSDYTQEILNVSVKLLKNNLLAYTEHVIQTRNDLAVMSNLNKQLFLEDLFLRWAENASS